MRGVLFIFILGSLLFLSSCAPESENEYIDIAKLNKVHLIDYPFELVDAKETQSIHELYENENKALSLYRKTLDLFPDEQPFSTIMLRQELQMELFEEAYAKYELNIPESSNWYPKVSEFNNLDEACAAAIIFAEQSVDLYDGWLENKGFQTNIDNQDLRFLYTKIRNDYQNTVIPQLKRCSLRIL